MSTTTRRLITPLARIGLGHEVIGAAIVAGLLGLAFLASTSFVLVLCIAAGGLLLLEAIARHLAVERATALFLVFILLMVSCGRDFSYVHLEAGGFPVYVTEMILAVLLMVATRRWLQQRLAAAGLWHAASLLLASYIVLGLVRLPFAVSIYGREAIRDAVICTYALFAFLTAWFLSSQREIRLFGGALILGSLGASAIIVTNAFAGEGVMTSTSGVVRYGAGIQAFSATFTALIWTALWVTGQLSRRAAIGGGLLVVGQTVISLFLVQHRSQLLALVAGLGVIAAANPRRRRMGGLALALTIMASLLLLLVAAGVLPGAEHPLWKATVERAASSVDPGADSSTDWRVQVNRYVLSEVLAHPLSGAGFGPAIAFRYTFADSDDVDPHNSFVAVLYRLGVPTALLLFACIGLLVRHGWVECRTAIPERRSQILAALAGLIAMGVFASFNVVLEGPYLGLFFWVPAGILLRLTSPRATADAHPGHP